MHGMEYRISSNSSQSYRVCIFLSSSLPPSHVPPRHGEIFVGRKGSRRNGDIPWHWVPRSNEPTTKHARIRQIIKQSPLIILKVMMSCLACLPCAYLQPPIDGIGIGFIHKIRSANMFTLFLCSGLHRNRFRMVLLFVYGHGFS